MKHVPGCGNPKALEKYESHRWKNLKAWRERNPDYQRGANNPSWKGGLSKSTICRIVRKVLTDAGRDQFVCESCGARRGYRQDIHHKDGNRANNVPENLAVLCPRCHNYAHNKLHESRRDEQTGRYTSVA